MRYALKERIRRLLWSRDPDLCVAGTAQVHPTAHIEPVGVGGSLRIGSRARIMQGVLIAASGGEIIISEDVFIGPYSVIYGHGGLTIGAGTLIAAHSIIIPANHVYARPDVPIAQQGITPLGIAIGSDVWIGCGARILDGVRIGDGAVIGAGAVVTHSVPDFAIAVGVPARVVGRRE